MPHNIRSKLVAINTLILNNLTLFKYNKDLEMSMRYEVQGNLDLYSIYGSENYFNPF